mgnify:CR=1 FL=1
MIRQCKQKKIDLILTKSISRFSPFNQFSFFHLDMGDPAIGQLDMGYGVFQQGGIQLPRSWTKKPFRGPPGNEPQSRPLSGGQMPKRSSAN